MERNRQLRKFSEDEVDSGGQGWLSWGAGMVAKPVAWAWRSYVQQQPQVYQGTYVITTVVKVRSLQFQKRVHQHSVLWVV